MPVELKIPAVGESITEVQISDWLKAEGDTLQADEPVAVIDSEKTTFELPSPSGGTLTRILHRAGETVPVGAVIGHIEAGGNGGKPKPAPEQSRPAPSGATAPPAQNASGGGAAQGTPPITSPRPEERKAPSPAAAPPPPPPAPAETAAAPPGTRSNEAGRQPENARGAREEKVIPMTMLRRTVARRLVEARQQMAMLTTFNEVDMSDVLATRQEHQQRFTERHHLKLGLMSFFIKAAVEALRQFPMLNAELRGDEIIQRSYFDIAVAIATERGLVVPVLRDAEALGFAELEKAVAAFAQRAKENKLKPEDLEGGTFTITNGGVFGSLLSTPIINPPQAGILGMHTIQERPVVVERQIVIRPMMYLALTYDHRLIDGREAVLFLRQVKETIESPLRLLLEV
jgi:2-oxoglutarate dehydrogenase E2 component (dihydrolipoamide succinyltransferase)